MVLIYLSLFNLHLTELEFPPSQTFVQYRPKLFCWS